MTSVNEVRFQFFFLTRTHQRKFLPPCSRSLLQKIRRTHLVARWWWSTTTRSIQIELFRRSMDGRM
uniref:Uncharacterized protein n=1 Tax=Lepeophtheirus salmonis TaxID=72036 RepID=A0A0K2VCU3_LEPSM